MRRIEYDKSRRYELDKKKRVSVFGRVDWYGI